jgi:hypothetical protein
VIDDVMDECGHQKYIPENRPSRGNHAKEGQMLCLHLQ